MYQVIARKYRPQNFAELVGQEHVRATLSNAISAERIAHGYIFSGQRGTGKTTVARILARCLNCEKGPTATPCLQCAACTEIAMQHLETRAELDDITHRQHEREARGERIEQRRRHLAELTEGWEALDFSARQALLRDILERVKVHSKTGGIEVILRE